MAVNDLAANHSDISKDGADLRAGVGKQQCVALFRIAFLSDFDLGWAAGGNLSMDQAIELALYEPVRGAS